MWGDRAAVFRQSPGFDDLTPGENLCTWVGIGDSVHRCMAHPLKGAGSDVLIPETGAFLRAMETLYGDMLGDYPCFTFLLITPQQLHAFVFASGVLVKYTQEPLSSVMDRAGLRTAADDLVSTIHTWGLPAVDTVLVAGHHPVLLDENLDWLPAFSESAQAGWVQTGDYLRFDNIDQRLGVLATPHALPLLVFGATICAETGWGADFTGQLQPVPVIKPKVERRPVRVPRAGSPIAAGAALGILVMVLVCFLAWNRATAREKYLQEQIVREKGIEKENQELQKKCDDLVQLKRSLDERAKWIQGNRDAQPASNTCFTLLRQSCPAGVVYTKVTLSGQSVSVTGFSSIGAFYGTGRPAQSQIDLPGLVTQLAENLRNTGKFTEIEPVLRQNPNRDQVDFTLTCSYSLPAAPTSVRVPPLSDSVVQGASKK
jgi:Tfp pilus assembly protein PilN